VLAGPIINNSTGALTGVVLTDNGNYQSVPPTITVVTTGGPNIPGCPTSLSSVRTHDYLGSFSYGYPGGDRPDLTNAYQYKTKWYGIDPADGSGNYDWSGPDQCILYNKGMGRTVLFTLYGTPNAYAQYPTLTDPPYNNYAGGSSPLNSLGLTMGTSNVGLQGFVTALMNRYNVNADLLINPVTGTNFPSGTRLIDYIEVWNEPTFGANGVPIANASGYYWIGTAAQLVDIAYIISSTAKAIDPLIKICGCGFTNYPMTYGTGQYLMFSNFLLATETLSGHNYSGYQLLDIMTIHPYDLLEKASVMIGASSSPVEFPINDMKHTMITIGGVAKPVIASEWGFFVTNSIFQTTTSDWVQGIQIKRVYATHALLGLIGSYGYSMDSIYLGRPTCGWFKYHAMKDINKLNGKTINSVYRSLTRWN